MMCDSMSPIHNWTSGNLVPVTKRSVSSRYGAQAADFSVSAIFLLRQADVLTSRRSQEERTVICTANILVGSYCSFLPTVINKSVKC
jgi:hypothetical protein